MREGRNVYKILVRKSFGRSVGRISIDARIILK
jgi:hypothetical protein